MRKYSYLVIGANVGTAIAAWLSEQADTDKVVIADRDMAIADRAAKHFPLIPYELNTEKLSGRELHAEFERHDVIVSAIPARFSPKLAHCAIETSTGFCDLGGVLPVTHKLRGMAKKAKHADVGIVIENGIGPGHLNVVADYLVGGMSRCGDISVTMRVGGLPQRPIPPLNYGRMFSPEGLSHLYRGTAPVLRNGRITEVTPFEEAQKVPVPETLKRLGTGFGHMESFPTAGAGLAPWSLMRGGARHFEEHTLRWPGFIHGVQTLSPQEFFRSLEPVGPSNPDCLYADVTVADRTGTIAEHSLYDEFDYETGLSAMARTTGFPAAVVAHMLANDCFPPGVWTPEEVLRATDLTERYLNQVNKALGLST